MIALTPVGDKATQTNVAECDKAYIAGQIDADGTICLGDGTSQRWPGVIAVCQLYSQDRQLLEWCQSLYGGKISSAGTHPCLSWRPESLITFVSDIRKYLRTKSEQADLLLEYKTRVAGQANRKTYKSLTIDEMREFVRRSKELNGRLPKMFSQVQPS